MYYKDLYGQVRIFLQMRSSGIHFSVFFETYAMVQQAGVNFLEWKHENLERRGRCEHIDSSISGAPVLYYVCKQLTNQKLVRLVKYTMDQ